MARKGRGRKVKIKGGKGLLMASGVVALGLALMSKSPIKKSSTGEQVEGCPKLKPEPVKGGETVSVSNYRVISARRPGMSYVEGQGAEGGPITISVPSNGTFTRNFVREGGRLYAELA